ncbi:hypothetical protein E1B28_003673 [Marasmius oreades]|uniref:Laccase n=1 Tax=Marasmius oreades TaxID=181124 RepID=A0A9P7UX08_9AGAR|nr:uncharacterized protein E1B28_003673 [Marasmius oreades]KAG7096220.1 hypothetical protein E1B28_003673 [Marasmius oreades]
MLNLLLPLTLIAGVCAKKSGSTIGPVADLPIVNAKIAPDGFTRSAVLPGGTFPGPVIVGKKNDEFKINVIDKLYDTTMVRSTSVHWHGLSQHGSNWADGTASVTQCPITPGGSFQHIFQAKDQAGTFWYHSHFSTQYCDGLRGVFVVYDPDDPHKSLYDVDDESTIITLADWYRKSTKYPPAPQYGPIAPPDSTLINGLGRYLNGTASPLAVVNVEHGKRYRFRLVSISCEPNYIFSIDGHDLTVIEVDGQNTVPLVVNSIQIYTGQRYSFVLNANAHTDSSNGDGNFWIRALPNFGVSLTFDQKTNLGILRYKHAKKVDPTTTQQANNVPLIESNLQPLKDPKAPGGASIDGADVDYNLVIGFDPVNLKFTINGAPYTPPNAPILLQILSGKSSPEQLLPPESIYYVPANKTIQLAFPLGAGGDTGGPHPMHLHGHSFSVIRSANSSTYNYDNPVRRDVVNTGVTGDNVTIRFFTDVGPRRTDNSAGVWFLHCHIDRHLDIGLAVVFAEDTRGIAKIDPAPQSWKDLCPAYEREFGPGGEVIPKGNGTAPPA